MTKHKKAKSSHIKSRLQEWSKTNQKPRYRLNLNEMPKNIPEVVRRKIGNAVKKMAFNRYPPFPIDSSILTSIAKWYRCETNQILVSTGASTFTRSLLTYFGNHHKRNIVIARPSFTYYERYCQLFNIPYKLWQLDKNFEYDSSALNNLQGKSIILLASPNNPTGGIITKEALKNLLQKHKTSLFVVDEAYAEFANITMLPMINKHKNLIILRTFSKAFCAAGIRCGVLFAQPSLIKLLNPLQTPRSLTQFTLSAIKEILLSEKASSWFSKQIQYVIKERERLYQNCVNTNSKIYKIYPSKGNFLLIKCKDVKSNQILLSSCDEFGVALKDIGNLPRLKNCVRVTIGLAKENDQFFKAFSKANEMALS